MPRNNDDSMNYRAPEGPGTPASPGGIGSDEYSRRKFLRAAVLGTAGVAGAAGVAGVVLAQRGSGIAPGIISIRQVTGTSDGDYTMLFEDTNCGTSGDTSNNCAACTNFSTTNFTVTTTKGNTHTNPGSFFVVLAIRGLPAGTYSILAEEKLSTDLTYQNIPTTATSALPFAYQGSGNVQVYEYNTGTISGNGPYALLCPPYNNPNTTVGLTYANGAADTFTTGSTQDVLIFIHVNWGAGAIGSSGATETIDFRVTLTNTGDSTSAVETTTTTGVQS